MAVELYISEHGRPRSEARAVPIATLSGFREHWLPAARALNLVWVPMFETGLPVRREDCPDVLAELEKLRGWARARPDTAGALLERLERLIDELQAVCGGRGVEVYIG